jgi:tetratricopeptide (TPR) repeat protein
VTACPPDDTLAALIAGVLEEARVDAIRAHVDSCESCRGILVAVAKGTPAGATPELDATAVDVRRYRAGAPKPASLPARYRIERVLGEGGMGRVYAAHDTELDRAVAVKVLRDDIGSAQLAERLVRESRAMAKVSHPGVVTVYDVGRHEGHVFIAMELVAGTTLSRWLSEKPRGWREIVDVFHRAGQGLAAAHEAGLVHRDMKPENVLVTVEGERVKSVAVSDFGIARAARDASGSRDGGAGAARDASADDLVRTATGALIGTPAYMAPEQLAGGVVDARADIFAFGVSLWEALYGARPYAGKTIAELAIAIERGAPVPPASTAPKWIANAVRSAIDPDPAKRPPSMTELLAAIDPARADRTRKTAVYAGIGIVVVGSVAFAVVPRLRSHEVPLPAMCSDPGMAATWTDASRAQIRTTLDALPGELPKSVAERAVQTADAYATRWTDALGAACKSTDVAKREASVACLGARRSAFAKTLGVVPSMKRTDLVDLDMILGKLPSVTLCQTDAAAIVMREVAPEARVRAAALEARLAEAGALIAAGSLDQAREELASIDAEVTALGSRVLAAEYAFARASVSIEHDVDGGLALYREAALTAGKAGRDDLAAHAWLEVAHEYAQTKNDAGRAQDALEQADAAITRGGEDTALRAHYDLELAQLRVFETKFDEAEKLLAAARIRIAKFAPQLMPDVEETHVSLLTEAGKLDEAIAAANALILERTSKHGEVHASVITIRNILANALLVSGKLDEALVQAQLAADLAKRGYGEDSDSYGLGLRNVSVLLENTGKFDEARTTIQKARQILSASRGPRSFMVGDTYQSEAILLAVSGKPEESLPLFDQAIAIYKDSVGERHVRTAEAMLSYAGTLSELNRGKEAVDKSRDAVALFRDVYGEENPRYAYARAMYGEALIRAKDKKAARIELEAAVAIYSRTEFIPTAKAAAKFNLAQAIVDDSAQTQRAMTLANEAIAVFAEAGPAYEPVTAKMKRWVELGGKEPEGGL